MSAEANAKALGIEFADDAEKAYLNMVARVGKTLLDNAPPSCLRNRSSKLFTYEGY